MIYAILVVVVIVTVPVSIYVIDNALRKMKEKYNKMELSVIVEENVWSKKHFRFGLFMTFIIPIIFSLLFFFKISRQLQGLIITIMILNAMSMLILTYYNWKKEGITRSIIEYSKMKK